MKDENILVIEKYLDSLRRQDLSDAPLADDVRFENPVAGKGVGAESMKAWLSGYLSAFHEVRVLHHVADGEYVVTHWESDSPFGTIQVLEKFRVREGLIVEAIAFLDPRPVFGN
ncbi:MAG: nuclear transport factor 2 family protein [Pyrinomonadaceae bacterium]